MTELPEPLANVGDTFTDESGQSWTLKAILQYGEDYAVSTNPHGLDNLKHLTRREMEELIS